MTSPCPWGRTPLTTCAVFLGCQEAVKAMRASPSKGEGCAIVLVGSQMGLDGFPELSPYIASKVRHGQPLGDVQR